MASDLLRSVDVSKRLIVSCTTVLRMIECRELPAICVRQGRKKKTYRVYEQALEKWLKSKTVTSARHISRKSAHSLHTNGRNSFTAVLPQDGKPMEVIEKSRGELDTPTGSYRRESLRHSAPGAERFDPICRPAETHVQIHAVAVVED
ncbi:MAG: hypothetical protein O7C72_10035 [Deltaproteobacteria bacterium]|nr:hypothetical protein [Deltaproteobacteria bacterium]